MRHKLKGVLIIVLICQVCEKSLNNYNEKIGVDINQDSEAKLFLSPTKTRETA